MKDTKKFEARREEFKKEQEQEKIYVASFGHNGKKVTVRCRRSEDGKFVGLNGEEIPEWADFEL